MNVYDFDNTNYPGDSTLDFWRFCLRRHPAALRPLPGAILSGALFQVKLGTREQFKGSFYRFLRHVPDVDGAVSAFWAKNLSRISPWYLEQKQEDDLIISASPDFLILPVCRLLNVRGIASPVAPDSGRLLGPNCRGAEKVARLDREYPAAPVEEFYSDSLSDAPLAQRARQAFLVKGLTLSPWPAD